MSHIYEARNDGTIGNASHLSRQTDKQTDRQTHRQTDTQTHRQTDRQTHRQTDRQTDRQANTVAQLKHGSSCKMYCHAGKVYPGTMPVAVG